MSRIPRPARTLPAPAAAGVAIALGVVLTIALDTALLWWAALIIGVVAAFAFVAWSGPMVPRERRAGADGAREEGTVLHNTLVVPTALVLSVV
ncbi:ABC transporter permease, partial [Nocardiopsis dassonvillei]